MSIGLVSAKAPQSPAREPVENPPVTARSRRDGEVDKPRNFVAKPMAACSGREIMTEVLGHLRIERQAAAILQSCICIPCMMPFITSQFLPREKGDRPQVVPRGWHHLAFMGQFCELPDDVVFTVEYSIRSAQTAVYSLLGLNREPPAVYIILD